MQVEKKVVPPKPQPEVVEYVVTLTQGDIEELRNNIGHGMNTHSLFAKVGEGNPDFGNRCKNIYKFANEILRVAGKELKID